MKDKEIMTLEKALFILRHGSAEGEHKYFEAITIIENEINRLQAENERLKNILICFMGALGKVRNVDDIESISQIPIMTELNKGIRAEIKAEAIKEFAERLKKELSFGKYIQSDQIDNLLKEMESDN